MEKKKKKLIHKLKNKYRLVIINDSTFAEKFSLSLTPMNVFVAFSMFLVFFASIIITLIVFTPVREYIPGYTDTETKQMARLAAYRLDSLEQAIKDKDAYYKNLLNIMNDHVEYSDTAMMPQSEKKSGDIGIRNSSGAESALRKEIEAIEDNYAVGNHTTGSDMIQKLNFFLPVRGMITEAFNETDEHYAIDVVTKADEPVKAIQEGRVILSSWTPETGNVIALQHRNNVVSVYKHNAVLLKKVGTFVNAGEPIAIVGNTGELTTGPHLHFEIWDNGKPVNPEEYINFN